MGEWMTILKDPPGPGEGRRASMGVDLGTRRTRRHGEHGGFDGGARGRRIGCNSEAYCTNEKTSCPTSFGFVHRGCAPLLQTGSGEGRGARDEEKRGVAASRRAWNRQRHVPSSIAARAPLLQYRGRKRRGMPGNPIEARPPTPFLVPRPSSLATGC